jgi:hypothetical protein
MTRPDFLERQFSVLRLSTYAYLHTELDHTNIISIDVRCRLSTTKFTR